MKPELKIDESISFDQQIQRSHLETLQVNMGSLCNLSCNHCHIGGNPKSQEIMQREVVDAILKNMDSLDSLKQVDITGGTPELNPEFCYLIEQVFKKGLHIIVRWNPTILSIEGYENYLEIYKKYNIELVASLPCYTEENVNSQRGSGVFNKSITALKKANESGYGVKDSGYTLNLVYNPGGSFLPPDQSSLESDYKQKLYDDFGVVFNSLFTITNMPIKRFKESLSKEKNLSYMKLLFENFNPTAKEHVMCKEQISVGWDGTIYDCDFNLSLGLKINSDLETNILKTPLSSFENHSVSTDSHCYGCTAGAGSSCGGTIA